MLLVVVTENIELGKMSVCMHACVQPSFNPECESYVTHPRSPSGASAVPRAALGLPRVFFFPSLKALCFKIAHKMIAFMGKSVQQEKASESE